MTTQGYAEVELHGAVFHASLRFHDGDGGIYHRIEATIDPDDNVEAMVHSPDRDVDAFALAGTIFRGEMDDGVHPMMILLTDGATVPSLTYGPCSNEDNYH